MTAHNKNVKSHENNCCLNEFCFSHSDAHSKNNATAAVPLILTGFSETYSVPFLDFLLLVHSETLMALFPFSLAMSSFFQGKGKATILAQHHVGAFYNYIVLHW